MAKGSHSFGLGHLVGVAVAALAVGFYLGSVFMQLRDEKAPTASPQAMTAPPAGMDAAGASAAAGPTPETLTRIAALERAAAAKPGDRSAWIDLGNACFDANLPQRAIRAYEKARAIAPLGADVLTDLGVMRHRAGEAKEAVACFDAALKLNSRHVNALYNKGVVLLHDLRDEAGARAAWERLLEINPGAKTPEGMPLRDMVDQLRRK